ncbi:hypothetical protein VTN96DRAFT_2312 [Rasamsonia emersonii]
MKACIVRQRTRFFSGLLLSLCAVPASSTVEKSTLTLHGEIRAVEPAGTIGGRWANGHGETGGHLGLAAAHLTALIRRGPRHSFRADRRCAPPGHSAWRQHRGARKPQSERCTLLGSRLSILPDIPTGITNYSTEYSVPAPTARDTWQRIMIVQLRTVLGMIVAVPLTRRDSALQGDRCMAAWSANRPEASVAWQRWV